jgi:hypothetical protein
MEEKKHALIQHISETNIKVLAGAVVPPDNHFNVVDQKGVLIKKFPSGSTNTLGELNCFLIACPESLPAGTKCWNCYGTPDKD